MGAPGNSIITPHSCTQPKTLVPLSVSITVPVMLSSFLPHIVAYHLQEAGCCLGLITPGKGLSKLHVPFATYGSPARIAARLQGDTLLLAAVAGGPKVANQVVLLEGVRQEDLQRAAEVGWKVVRSSAELQVCCLQRAVARMCVLRAPIKQVCLYSCPRRCKANQSLPLGSGTTWSLLHIITAKPGCPSTFNMSCFPSASWCAHLSPTAGFSTLPMPTPMQLDEGFLSVPEAIEFPTDNGQTAHLLYYAPRNRDHILPEGQRPPLLVRSHGGPTSAAQVSLDLTIQYLTSRGAT